MNCEAAVIKAPNKAHGAGRANKGAGQFHILTITAKLRSCIRAGINNAVGDFQRQMGRKSGKRQICLWEIVTDAEKKHTSQFCGGIR